MPARNDSRPRLILALADSAQAVRRERAFRRHGWEVHRASSGSEARRLAARLLPQLVILDTDLHEESGWLTCAKLHLEQPKQKILLVGPDVSPRNTRLSEFVGAMGLVSASDDLGALVRESNAACGLASAR